MTIHYAKFRRFPLYLILALVIWYLPVGFSPARLKLYLETTADDIYQVYFDTGAGFNERQSEKVELDANGKNQTLVFPLSPKGIRGLRIDPGKTPKTVRIRAIRLSLCFGSFGWTAEEIPRAFKPLKHIRGFTAKSGILELVTTGEDPIFAYIGKTDPVFELVRVKAYLCVLMASLMTALCLCLLLPLKPRQAPEDVPSSGKGSPPEIPSASPEKTLSMRGAKHWILWLFVIDLAALYLLVPDFFHGSHYIYPDLFLKYPAWNEFIDEDPQYSSSKSDFIDLFHPLLDFYDGLRQGEFRKWSPYHSFGRPLGGIFLSGHLSPTSFAIGPFFSPPMAFSLSLVLKYLLGSLGMFLFVARLTRSQPSALFAGTVFPLTAFNIVWFLGNAASASLYFPWFFWAIHHLVDAKSRASIWSMALALVTCAAILTGFAAVSGFGLYSSGLYFLFLAYRSGKAYPLWPWRCLFFLRKGTAYGIGIALGLGLTAFSFLPTLEYLGWANVAYRKENAQGYFPLSTVGQLLNPMLRGNDYQVPYQGPANYNETSFYIGTVALFLALAALGTLRWKKDRASKLFFLALAMGSLAVVFNFFGALYLVNKLPIFNSSINTRLISLFCFCATTLAALGIEPLFAVVGRAGPSNLFRLTATAFVLAGILVFFLDLAPSQAVLKTVDSLAHASWGWSLAGLMAILGIIALVKKYWVSRTLGTVLLTVVALSELLWYAHGQVPMLVKKNYFPVTPGVRFLKENLAAYERMLNCDTVFVQSATERNYGLTSPIAHGLHSPLEKKLLADLAAGIWRTPTTPVPVSDKLAYDSPLLNLFGIKYLVTVPDRDIFTLPGFSREELERRFEVAYDLPGSLRVYRNKGYSGIAFLVNRIRRAQTDEAIEAILTEPGFDPAREAVISPDTDVGWIAEQHESEPNFLEIQEYGFERVVFGTRSDQPAVLATGEVDYPGWEVLVDGTPGRVIKVNGLFRGVALTPGAHRVTFHYQPESFARGTVISLTSLILLAIVGAVGFGVKPTRDRSDSPDENHDEDPSTSADPAGIPRA